MRVHDFNFMVNQAVPKLRGVRWRHVCVCVCMCERVHVCVCVRVRVHVFMMLSVSLSFFVCCRFDVGTFMSTLMLYSPC